MNNIKIKTGKLYIFTSYTPGAGKSYLMLQKALERKNQGEKVEVAFIYGKHRDFDALLEGNGVRDYTAGKYSLKKIIESNPDVVVLDELGVRGANKDKKTFVYEDIEKLLEEGIDVYTSVNLKRFESVNPIFKKITGLTVKTKLPDKFLHNAYQIYFVDRSPEKMKADYEKGQLFDERHMSSSVMKKNFDLRTLEQYRKVSFEYLEKNYKDKLIVVKR